MARLRSAPVAQPSPPKAQTQRPALREKTNTSRAKAPVYEDDGNTEDLVKTAKARRGRPRKSAHTEEELVMAGGLGQTDAAAEAPRSDAPMTTDELAKSDGPPPTVKPNKRPPRMARKPVQSEAQSNVLEGLKKRMEATARHEAARKDALPAATESTASLSDPLPTKRTAARKSTSTAHERSEYSISPSPPLPGKLSSAKRSSLAHSGTPAVESSILALKNFKRRPRQPSMLQMVQQRTASARPSAVNRTANEDLSIFDIEVVGDEVDEEEEDEFAPEAEGTPLQVKKAKRRASASAKKKQTSNPTIVEGRPVVSSKKRKSEEVDKSSSALEALRAKRQKSDGPGPALNDELPMSLERSASPGRRMRESSDRHATPEQQITSDVQVINSSPSSTPPTEPSSDRDRTAVNDDYAVPSTEKEQDFAHHSVAGALNYVFEPDAPNGTMAEPASSSPSPEDPLAAQEQAELLAEPVTQVTQQSPVRQLKEPKKKAKPVSTATLQSLLPKRRQPPKARHRKTVYDFTSDEEDDAALDASHLEDDEDELGGRLRRQKATTPAKSRKTAASKAKARQTKATQPARKSAAVPAERKSSAALQGGKKPARTYGRAANTASDKENDGDTFELEADGDGTELPEISLHEVAGSKELEVAKRKFAEVDEWDMEFESMSAEDHRSSSQQWR
ncbi:hypothetical protein LTR36_010237 [Oleoguttula mirabilis]|uniref:Uncharacterized protein n=1 Tax=Oleoguttula mirabilis TaxID=1507867 RepID=A0AAV9JSJ3_9PEZI|nr:hypothetical protein LTR36_010237 [Oleoguttula mirabilis]